MNLLALDLGTDTGFAVTRGNDVVRYGEMDFSLDRFEGAGMRALKFDRWLLALFKDHDINAVAFEKIHNHAGTAAAHVYGGFSSLLMARCEGLEIPYTGLDVGTIKKSWAGKGNASKDAMIAEAVRRGFDPKTDDAADALAIAHLWMEKYGDTGKLELEDLL